MNEKVNKYISFDIGIKNLGYCLIKKNEDKKYGFEILKWGIINLVDNDTKVKSTKLDIISQNLYSKLDENKDFLDVEEVLIENQPSLLNPVMKSIMMLIYSYFMINGICKKKINNIKLISPSNKIKIYKIGENKIKDMKKEKNSKNKIYKYTKSLGEKLCLELIKDDNINLKILESYKKKDDLSDSFLQAFYYIFCKKEIPQNIKEILNNI